MAQSVLQCEERVGERKVPHGESSAMVETSYAKSTSLCDEFVRPWQHSSVQAITNGGVVLFDGNEA
eukprot:3367941-Prymnesium_polylepis.2